MILKISETDKNNDSNDRFHHDDDVNEEQFRTFPYVHYIHTKPNNS